MELGRAYQITDDIFDYVGDAGQLGKGVRSDLAGREGDASADPCPGGLRRRARRPGSREILMAPDLTPGGLALRAGAPAQTTRRSRRVPGRGQRVCALCARASRAVSSLALPGRPSAGRSTTPSRGAIENDRHPFVPCCRRVSPARVAVLALEKKAEEISILDLTGLSAACDYFVVCSAGSEQQVRAIAEHIADEARASAGLPPWHVEGRSHRRWILLDFVDVVVHVFHHETRQYYMLERLWGDAKVTHVREPKRSARVEA